MFGEGGSQAETLSEDKRIWLSADGEREIVLPQEGTISQNEGTHLGVKPVGRYDWREADLSDTASSLVLSLGLAKLITEGRDTPDFWTNIHLNSSPGAEGRINVWGRDPSSEAGWTKPVVIQDQLAEEEPRSIDPDTEETINRYIPLWDNLSQKMGLFEGGVSEVDRDSEEFAELTEKFATKRDPYKEGVLWANEKFVVVNVLVPHLNGLHLVIHPRESYWDEKGEFRRPWQQRDKNDLEYIRAFVEAFTILLASYKLISETGDLPFYNPDIHFSGNWAKDLLREELGGKLDLSSAISDDKDVRKEEKRSHKVGAEDEFQTAVHIHLYMTDNPDKHVSLPERPASEAPEQWSGISPTDPSLVEIVRNKLHQNLTTYLEENLVHGEEHGKI